MFPAKSGLPIAVVACLLPFGAASQSSTQITLKGETVCLDSLDAKRPQTGCRIGFRDDRDRYYSLKEASWPKIKRPPNQRVRVTGSLTRGVIDGYRQVGLIVATQIEPIFEPKPVTGTYLCLPGKNRQGPQFDMCVIGIRTQGGLYWGLNLSALDSNVSQKLALGSTISIEAQIIGVEPKEQRLYEWYPVEGVLKVLRLNKSVPPPQADPPPESLPRHFPKPTTRGLQ